MLKYIKEFLCSILKTTWPLILANPISFLCVTGVFIVILTDQEVSPTCFQEWVLWFLIYVLVLYAAMDKKPLDDNKPSDNKNIVKIKQKNISLFNIFNGSKK